MRKFLSLVGVVLAVAAPLRAELAPEIYIELQNKAAEVLEIRVDEVDSKPKGFLDRSSYTETVKATVTAVTRTRSGAKKGDAITVIYQRLVPGRGWTGASPPPQLKRGRAYTAWLERNADGTFGISARGMSFRKSPD